MSILVTVSFADGVYTPFFQDVRGGADGKSPVGTVHMNTADVGDGSGGIVTATYTMDRIVYGFRALIVPTQIVSFDNLATPEVVKLQYQSNNRRMITSADQASLAVAAQSGNVAKFDESGILLENEEAFERAVISLVWSTNTNTIVYQTKIFAAVFDAEVIEAQGSVSDFLAGVR